MISRQTFLNRGMTGVASLLFPNVNKQKEPKAPVLLVHGAWHGGWCWKRVRKILNQNKKN
jgi:hypothetical protein